MPFFCCWFAVATADADAAATAVAISAKQQFAVCAARNTWWLVAINRLRSQKDF